MKRFILFGMLLLSLAACHKDPSSTNEVTKLFSHTGFNRVEVGDNITLRIKKGTNFCVAAKGNTDAVNDLRISISAINALQVNYASAGARPPVELLVTLPELELVKVSGSAKLVLSGFSASPLGTYVSMDDDATGEIEAPGDFLGVPLKGNAVLHCKGNTLAIVGTVRGSALLEAYNTNAEQVDLQVSGNSVIKVNPLKRIYAELADAAHIYCKGAPATKYFEINDNAQVTHE